MTDVSDVRTDLLATTKVERHILSNDLLEAVFLPEAGGRLQSLHHVEHGDLIVPMQSERPDLDEWPKSGAFPLFPFHNRLRGAAISVAGCSVRLKPNTANGTDVMHGPAHRRAWRVTAETPNAVEMTLHYQADKDWPFDFTAKQRFSLTRTALHVELSLHNTGQTAMPGGMGWHPYLSPPVDGQVLIDARSQWSVLDADQGGPVRSPHAGRRFAATDTVKHFSDWTDAVYRVGERVRLRLTSDPGLAHLVVHQKPGYLCLEPVSHVAGALVMLPEPSAETGLRILEPGECMKGDLVLQVEGMVAGA